MNSYTIAQIDWNKTKGKRPLLFSFDQTDGNELLHAVGHIYQVLQVIRAKFVISLAGFKRVPCWYVCKIMLVIF